MNISPERKAAIIKKMLPPNNVTVTELSKQEGISKPTLYAWRSELKKMGNTMGEDGSSTAKWSNESKFLIVVETAQLSESELSQYCREKGLYSEEVSQWRSACIQGNSTGPSGKNKHDIQRELKAAKIQIKTLEKELKYKEKALAETAALLVLRKKLSALWDSESVEA